MDGNRAGMYTRLAPVLNVADVPAERAFYERLGIPVIYEGPEYPDFVAFGTDTIHFGIQPAASANDPPSVLTWQIGVTDIDAAIELCTSAAIDFELEHNNPAPGWNYRRLLIRTPSGYRLAWKGLTSSAGQLISSAGTRRSALAYRLLTCRRPVRGAGPVGGPRFTAGQKLAGPQILGVLGERLRQMLNIHADPAAVAGMPVLGDPVIKALARLKVRAEPAPGAGGDPPVAQQRAAEYREVTAGADNAAGLLPRHLERSRVQGQQRRDDRSGKSRGKSPRLLPAAELDHVCERLRVRWPALRCSGRRPPAAGLRVTCGYSIG